jgi:glutamate synthase (NADPH/NADH) small chain
MPARLEEVHHAEEEGIEFMMLTNPTRFIGDENGRVSGIECQKMELGEPNESGRRKPIPSNEAKFIIEVQNVIEAVGQSPNPIIQSTTPGLKTGRKGVVVTDDVQHTSREGIFAGGDLSRGGATVILAMRDGKIAANEIHNYLQKKFH